MREDQLTKTRAMVVKIGKHKATKAIIRHGINVFNTKTNIIPMTTLTLT